VSSEAAETQSETDAEVTVVEQSVRVVRSVRFGRVIVSGAVFGAVVAALLTLAFPVASANYTLGQAVGFMALIGAGIGLALGSIFALVLNRAVTNRTGTAVAKRSDVR